VPPHFMELGSCADRGRREGKKKKKRKRGKGRRKGDRVKIYSADARSIGEKRKRGGKGEKGERGGGEKNAVLNVNEPTCHVVGKERDREKGVVKVYLLAGNEIRLTRE